METNGVIKIHKVALIAYTQKELKPGYIKTNEINTSARYHAKYADGYLYSEGGDSCCENFCRKILNVYRQ